MKKNTSWKFTDESSITFQSSISGAGEFGHNLQSELINGKMFVYIAIERNTYKDCRQQLEIQFNNHYNICSHIKLTKYKSTVVKHDYQWGN